MEKTPDKLAGFPIPEEFKSSFWTQDIFSNLQNLIFAESSSSNSIKESSLSLNTKEEKQEYENKNKPQKTAK
ncbi:hypothetical protein [Methanosarcina sp.]|uniref:hypothetical protein n=1 Tax=Methanosarcina sp. TaxID=2213 RepID=UPI002D0ABBE5|nr:hypothetical protein [Methanosarcina sp.]HOW14029.1 hypothetical protein [Methanosarcina sp.]